MNTKERLRKSNYPVTDNLKRITEERTLSRPAIARRSGITPKKLSDIMNGYVLVRACEILRLAETLDIGVEELFKTEE